MGATEEQMTLLSAAQITHVSYILILYSIAFLLYLFVNILLHIFATYTWPDDESNGQIALAKQMKSKGTHSRNVSFVPRGLGVEMRGVGTRTGSAAPSPFLDIPEDDEEARQMNGHARPTPKPRMPKRAHRVTDSQQVRDAEEFELEGLISDVDDDAEDVSPGEDGQNKHSGGNKEMV